MRWWTGLTFVMYCTPSTKVVLGPSRVRWSSAERNCFPRMSLVCGRFHATVRSQLRWHWARNRVSGIVCLTDYRSMQDVRNREMQVQTSTCHFPLKEKVRLFLSHPLCKRIGTELEEQRVTFAWPFFSTKIPPEGFVVKLDVLENYNSTALWTPSPGLWVTDLQSCE